LKIYKVGGAVRDHLLGIPSKDNDYVVVESSPQEMLDLGYESVGKDFPVFLHPGTREEYALARKESKRGYGYKGFDFEVSNVTLEDDLFRRDLTINAIAMDANNTIIDPYEGVSDLKKEILRHVSDHFREDPLRVLRVARFAAKLDFGIHETTLKLMCDIVESGELNYLTPERIRLELEKALATPKPSLFFRVLNLCGALKVIFPELYNLIGVEHSPDHHPEGDGFEHTLSAIDYACELSDKISVRFATLTHDFGKALTKKEDYPHHLDHDINGVPLVEKFCERLKVSNEFSTLALKVTRWHMLAQHSLELKAKNILKLLTSINAIRNPLILEDFLVCCQADNLSKLNKRRFVQKPFLELALEEILNLNIKSLTQKYSGKVLGDEIKAHRILALKKFQSIFKSNRGEEIIIQKNRLIKKFKQNHPNKVLVGLVIAGSHFFDMDSEKSDLDFKGIYLSYDEEKRKEINYGTNQTNTQRNTSEDVDCNLFSIDKFLDLLANGDFNMLEMLFAPSNKILIDTPLYQWLRKIRNIFITKDISAFIGFIKKEFFKFGISKDNFNAQIRFLEFLKKYSPETRLINIWQDIEEYSKDEKNLMRITTSKTGSNVLVKSFIVAQRLYQATISISYLRDSLEEKISRYGHRMKNRGEDGFDYKGLYHSMRLVMEAKDIVERDTLELPFSQKRKEILRKIKNGEIDKEELSNNILKEIEYLRQFDHSDDKNKRIVEYLVERIKYNLKTEIQIMKFIKGTATNF